MKMKAADSFLKYCIVPLEMAALKLINCKR